jgi:cobaltochelatase CobN
LRSDTPLALLRVERGDGKGGNASLIRALARALGLGFDPLDCDLGQAWEGRARRCCSSWTRRCGARPGIPANGSNCWHDLIEQALEGDCSLEGRLTGNRFARCCKRWSSRSRPTWTPAAPPKSTACWRPWPGVSSPPGPAARRAVVAWTCCPPGATYTVDVRNLPTTTAWRLGFASANLILERHLQDHGDHLRQLGLSVWGTATMRTGGDDIAQAMALMGVRPVWATGSQRVDDFEILPLSLLDRPRRCHAAGLGLLPRCLRNLIRLFDAAVQAVAALDEPDDLNPLAARCVPSVRRCSMTAWMKRRRARPAGGCSAPSPAPMARACRTPSTGACGTAARTWPRSTSTGAATPTAPATKAPRPAHVSPSA